MNVKEIDLTLQEMLGEHVHIKVAQRGRISGRVGRAAIQPSVKHPHYGLTYYIVSSPGATIIFCAAHVADITDRQTRIILNQ